MHSFIGLVWVLSLIFTVSVLKVGKTGGCDSEKYWQLNEVGKRHFQMYRMCSIQCWRFSKSLPASQLRENKAFNKVTYHNIT